MQKYTARDRYVIVEIEYEIVCLCVIKPRAIYGDFLLMEVTEYWLVQIELL